MGGLGIGLLGLWFVELLGVGYGSGPSSFAIPDALAGDKTLQVLVALAGLKILATSITIGSGGSGGVFAPSLFIGAMLGGAFGELVHSAWPGTTAPSGAYALVGMAAVFSAASRAPITSIVILFEMTRDYSIIPPLMTAVVIATVAAQLIRRDTIYTLKLRRRGIEIEERREESPLTTIAVGQAMNRSFNVIRADMPVDELLRVFSGKGSRQGALPVVDDDKHLIGVVAPRDLDRVLEKEFSDLKVEDIAIKNPVTIYPDQTLEEAIHRMSAQSVGQLPVVSRGDPRVLLGRLRRSDVFNAYGRAASARRGTPRQLSPLAGLEAYGTEVVEISVPVNSPLIGKALKDIDLPNESIVVSIIRDSEAVIPRGNVTLNAGDRLIVVTVPTAREAVLERLTSDEGGPHGAHGEGQGRTAP
jgi:CIC family chloride channel protein